MGLGSIDLLRGKLAAQVCAAVGIFLLSAPGSSRAGSATDEIRTTHEKVQTIQQDPRLRSDARKKERQSQLRQTLGRRFDFAEMAKRSLGSHWQGRTKQERTEFVKLFTDVLEASYLDQIDPYLGEKFIYLREIRDGDFSEVATKIVPAKGDEIAINYKLRSDKSGWRIYDVVVENVSVVNNYRSQFSRVLSGASFQDLLQKLRETRVNQLQAKRPRPDTTVVSYWILAQTAPQRPR
ncbi:MAG TPA: ABC transporter substrate-binding protein [Candidatus Binatia bacterium]|jgi:phospholipid transport system substrate-binding protein